MKRIKTKCFPLSPKDLSKEILHHQSKLKSESKEFALFLEDGKKLSISYLLNETFLPFLCLISMNVVQPL